MLTYDLNYISAAGGNSTNNNGSGAGGMVKISFESFPNRAHWNFLWININQGKQSNNDNIEIYSNGIFYGPTCFPG
jgi:hypothetical protein